MENSPRKASSPAFYELLSLGANPGFSGELSQDPQLSYPQLCAQRAACAGRPECTCSDCPQRHNAWREGEELNHNLTVRAEVGRLSTGELPLPTVLPPRVPCLSVQRACLTPDPRESLASLPLSLGKPNSVLFIQLSRSGLCLLLSAPELESRRHRSGAAN